MKKYITALLIIMAGLLMAAIHITLQAARDGLWKWNDIGNIPLVLSFAGWVIAAYLLKNYDK